MRILHITPDFNYACGRSYYVFLLLKYFQMRGYYVHLLTNSGDSLCRLKEKNIPHTLIKSLHSKSPFSVSKNILAIKKLIKENHIDIIHTHHRFSEFLAMQSRGSANTKKIKTVFTALSILKRRYKIEFRSDEIIAVSNAVKKMLVEKFFVDVSKINVIYNFTDTDEIHELELLAPGLKDHGSTFNILSIGRFHHEKNFETLLKALKIINDSSIKTTIVGDGEDKCIYENYIKENNLNVELIEPQKDLLQYFFKTDLCVLSSARDPFPNFMLQAGLHNKIFIGANVDGIGEMIKDGVNGFLFSSKNAKELAEKIFYIKNNFSKLNNIRHKLHEDVINNYTQEFIIPNVMNIYNRK